MSNRKKNSSSESQPKLDFQLTVKQALALSGALSLLYFAYSFISDGFYQDDEVAHYQNMRLFWQQPEVILGNWAKPGFKIVYVVPALLGHQAVVFLNALITGLMAFTGWRISKELHLKHADLTLALCGFQPLLFQLSFRTYSELLTGALLALLVLSVLREKHFAAAFLSTWLISLRQEMAFLVPLVFAWLVWKKEWKAIPVMLIPPFLLLLAGKLSHGDWLWILNEAKAKGTDTKFVRQGFWHYFTMFTPVFGSIPGALFVAGTVAFAQLRKQTVVFSRLAIVMIPLAGYFLIHCLLTSEFLGMSSSAGNLRYVVVIAPLVSVIAVLGLDRLLESRTFISAQTVAVGVFGLAVLFFFSFAYDHLKFLPERDESRWLAVIILLGILYFWHSKKRPTKSMLAGLAILMLAFTLYNEPPKKNSAENETVKAITGWMNQQQLLERRVLINHPMFYFYSKKQFRMPDSLYPGLYLKELEASGPGTIAIWDSHYSDRPEYKMDVPYQWFEARPEWKLLRQWPSPDRRYVALVFEKQ
jgi:hypothetical protein